MNAIVNLSKLFKFNGGVHPPEHKFESTSMPIRTVLPAHKLVLPLRQHVGNVSKLQVKVGDHVLKGQLLAMADGQLSAAVHASTSGTIVSIEDQPIPHPSGLPDISITLQPDGEDRWIVHAPIDYRSLSKAEVLERLRDAGVVGLGGATFPSHIKLRGDVRQPVRTLILNGAECEPYISCDDMLMRERALEIVRGIEIMQYLLDAKECIIGVEDNKPEATQAMRDACAQSAINIAVVNVPTIYPGGGAKQLIKVLTGKEVPSGKLPNHIGVQCFNVATAYSVHRLVNHGEPVISRIVTVTGNVKQPGNFEVLLGVSIEELIAHAGGSNKTDSLTPDNLIMGGPMMGFNLPSAQVPVVKATNCIIVSAPEIFPPLPPAMPCIRCARCADACPVSLQPQELYWFSRGQELEKARDYQLFDCIECGCCSYVCPSNIPLVQYYRYAKSEIIAQDKAKLAADIARERNEFRLMRIEREKQERAQRHAQKTAGTSSDTAVKTEDEKKADEAKKAAIAAAVERAKVQKAGVTPQNTEHVSSRVETEITDIDERRTEAQLIVAQTQMDGAKQEGGLIELPEASNSTADAAPDRKA
jgi:electron transport complex protein RnfC